MRFYISTVLQDNVRVSYISSGLPTFSCPIATLVVTIGSASFLVILLYSGGFVTTVWLGPCAHVTNLMTAYVFTSDGRV